MFENCKNIKDLNLSNFKTTNVINMSNMFNNCTSLTNLDIPYFVIENNTRIKYMFSNCNFCLQNKIKTQLKNINNNAFIKGKKNMMMIWHYLMICLLISILNP